MRKHSKEENKRWSKFLMQAMRFGKGPAKEWYKKYLALQAEKDKILAETVNI